MFNTMGLSQKHQQGKCVVVGHCKACNNRGRVRQDWMAVRCVTSPASPGLLRPICVHTHTHTCTRRRAGARERKGIVNRKHAGLARDWEVILDHWPLNVFCFCFTLKFLREAFAFHSKAITMQGIMGDWHWAFRPSLECFFPPSFHLNCLVGENGTGAKVAWMWVLLKSSC